MIPNSPFHQRLNNLTFLGFITNSLQMKFYKVVDFIDKSIDINTKATNYSLTLVHLRKYSKLLQFVTTSSAKYNLPLDFYFSILTNLAFLGNVYLSNIPKPINGTFEVSKITTNVHHQGVFIKESVLIDIINGLLSLGITPFWEGNYLWEFIFEEIRHRNSEISHHG